MWQQVRGSPVILSSGRIIMDDACNTEHEDRMINMRSEQYGAVEFEQVKLVG